MLKRQTAIKTVVELILSKEEISLLKVQRKSLVLDSEPEMTPMERIASSINSDRAKESKSTTFDLLTKLIARKEELSSRTRLLLDGALDAPKSTKGLRSTRIELDKSVIE